MKLEYLNKKNFTHQPYLFKADVKTWCVYVGCDRQKPYSFSPEFRYYPWQMLLVSEEGEYYEIESNFAICCSPVVYDNLLFSFIGGSEDMINQRIVYKLYSGVLDLDRGVLRNITVLETTMVGMLYRNQPLFLEEKLEMLISNDRAWESPLDNPLRIVPVFGQENMCLVTNARSTVLFDLETSETQELLTSQNENVYKSTILNDILIHATQKQNFEGRELRIDNYIFDNA